MAGASAAGPALIDAVFVARRQIFAVYLLDAAAACHSSARGPLPIADVVEPLALLEQVRRGRPALGQTSDSADDERSVRPSSLIVDVQREENAAWVLSTTL